MVSFTDLQDAVLVYNPHTDLTLLKHVYDFAEQLHHGQTRLSGEPYITHPLAVALILCRLNVDDATLAAALLHDVLEDAQVDETTLAKQFGTEITSLVVSMTKINRLDHWTREEYDAANIRKVLLAGTQDLRVLFLKLADKLHNMQTLSSLSNEQQLRISREVLHVYAPLAYRLGIHWLKAALEDLAFPYVFPHEYTEITTKLAESADERQQRIDTVLAQITETIKQLSFHAKVYGRVKHLYSIYRKIVDRSYDLAHMYDIAAIRVLTDDVAQCYTLLHCIHKLWRPIPGTFKDYIANPKPNGYQSLHTSVLGTDGKPLEFQIRTFTMHETAEEGIAAHSAYKGLNKGEEIDKRLAWMKQLLDDESLNNTEFLSHVKADFFGDTICVFTPKGDIIELPPQARVLDFAYAIHSTVGDHATGALVNGIHASLRAEVHNGDIVEIITSKIQEPRNHWLKIVYTTKAKQHIRNYLRKKGITPMTASHAKKDAQEVKTHTLLTYHYTKEVMVTLGKCCEPLPGQEIIGHLVSIKQLRVHRTDCPSVVSLPDKKRILVSWVTSIHGLVEIVVEAHDRVGLLAELLHVFSREGCNLEKASAKTLNVTYAQCRLSLHVDTIQQLQELLEKLQKISGVLRVYIGDFEKKKK